jgi:hypothetical protein
VTRSSPRLIQAVRSTLDRLQRSEELAPDDPALAELKESVLSKIVELEVAKTPKAPAPPKRILWISKKASGQAQVDEHAESPAESDSAHLKHDATK